MTFATIWTGLKTAASLVNSKAGIAGVGIILLLCFWGWHKAASGLQALKISGLENQIVETEGKVIEQQNLKQVCEFNLVGARDALSQQNAKIETMEQEADQRVATATALALASLTPDEVVEKKVTGPPGHEEMNLFMIAEFGRDYR